MCLHAFTRQCGAILKKMTADHIIDEAYSELAEEGNESLIIKKISELGELKAESCYSWRYSVLNFSLVLVPAIFTMTYVLAVPLSGQYNNAPFINRQVFSWYFEGLYNLSTFTVGVMLISTGLLQPSWRALGFIVFSFFLIVSLCFEISVLSRIVQELIAIFGSIFFLLFQACFCVRRYVKKERIPSFKDWCICVFAHSLVLVLYFYCVASAHKIKVVRSNGSLQSIRVVMFTVGCSLIRSLTWHISKRHRSYSDPTMPHFGHMNVAVQHLIYYAFYRTLFESFTSYVPFLISAALGVAVDMLLYVFCMTDAYMDFKDRITSSVGRGMQACIFAAGCGRAAAPVNPKCVHSPLESRSISLSP
jgi:hypothetical protein